MIHLNVFTLDDGFPVKHRHKENDPVSVIKDSKRHEEDRPANEPMKRKVAPKTTVPSYRGNCQILCTFWKLSFSRLESTTKFWISF